MSNPQHDQKTRFSLHGKIALVTGGHRGIGRSISIGIAQAGGDVIVLDQNGPQNSDVPQTIHNLGRRHWSVKADLSNPDEIQAAIATTYSLVDSVDILVNNAGITRLAALEDLSIADWDITMAVNVRAPFLLARALASGPKGMLAKGRGVIVNVSSVSGKIALEHHGVYCASKGALDLLTKVMTAEWAARGIRANGVAPTVVMTEMGKQVWGGEAGRMMMKKIPQGRFVEPFEVADLVVFLASDAASMINGEIVVIDGGLTVI